MPDSRILLRLGELLGVTADDLLSVRYAAAEEPALEERALEDSSEPDPAKALEKEVSQRCRERLEALYGTNAPPEAVSRLLAEEALLRADGAGTDPACSPIGRLFLLDTAAALIRRLRERGGCASLFLPTGVEWTAFLMGASDVDPLPPHRRCPSCGRVEFARFAASAEA